MTVGDGRSDISGESADHIDFFVSYAAVDEHWAEWVAWQIESVGHSTRIQVWDHGVGAHLIHEIHRATRDARRTAAILSAGYLESPLAEAEWQTAWSADPSGRNRSLLIIRIEACDPPGLLRQIETVDLFGIDEDTARRRLLAAINNERAKPAHAPDFPGDLRIRPPEGQPRFPGSSSTIGPRVWNVPSRLATFTGREEKLISIHERLNPPRNARVATVQTAALHGLGGVGKTQLAIEYAHRHAVDYKIVWWIEAEQTGSINAQLAALALRAGFLSSGSVDDDAEATLRQLRWNENWLLIFDNALSASAIRAWLPDGGGHVLLTSRDPNWGQLASPILIDVLSRSDAISLMRLRVEHIDEEIADALAEELGDLPLALEQAAAYLNRTGIEPRGYVRRFRKRRRSMLEKGNDLVYGGTIDTVWSLALERLRKSAPAAATLLRVCAGLAPEPIPISMFVDHAYLLPPPLSEALTVDDPETAMDEVVGELLAYSLAKREADSLIVHRLVSSVIAFSDDAAATAAMDQAIAGLLSAAAPGEPEDPSSWNAWAALGPHLLYATKNLPAENLETIRTQVHRFAIYLSACGDYSAAYPLVLAEHTERSRHLGKGHVETLHSANLLGVVLWAKGEIRQAYEIDVDTHVRRQRILGPNHPDTLTSASNVAVDLIAIGNPREARTLSEDTLARAKTSFGDDHSETLQAVTVLALSLAELGDFEYAANLNRQTLRRRRKILGANHPDTLWSANNLAGNLVKAGRHLEARDLVEDAVARARETLGDGHLVTLQLDTKFASTLAGLGDIERSCELHQQILDRRTQIFGPDHPDTLSSAHYLAEMLLQLREYGRCRTLAKETLIRRRKSFGYNHPDTRKAQALIEKIERELPSAPGETLDS